MSLLCVRLCLYVIFTTGLVAAAEHVTGPLNGRITLPCKYSAKTTSMCWGRGRCPNFWCNDEILRTDGYNVTWRKSDRYQLLGHIRQGDVSLTITGATKEDEGTYCCRVEIPGLGNDLKIEIKVKIQEVAPSPPDPTKRTTKPYHTTHGIESPSVTPKTISDDSSLPSTVKPASQSLEIEDSLAAENKRPYIIASVVVIIVLLIAVAALLLRYRHTKRKNKDKSRTIVSLEGLERTPDHADQNIYTIYVN
ncbi:hepatitis A virus cellular receptor 1 homolog [Engystomops pustulosus]|uniref:hepatitis A virus cellular receptor 1 homolog n=1 Tax=Engystomops pustulosus TaxID=76066 RepID=UPI003AFA7919